MKIYIFYPNILMLLQHFSLCYQIKIVLFLTRFIYIHINPSFMPRYISKEEQVRNVINFNQIGIIFYRKQFHVKTLS